MCQATFPKDLKDTHVYAKAAAKHAVRCSIQCFEGKDQAAAHNSPPLSQSLQLLSN